MQGDPEMRGIAERGVSAAGMAKRAHQNLQHLMSKRLRDDCQIME